MFVPTDAFAEIQMQLYKNVVHHKRHSNSNHTSLMLGDTLNLEHDNVLATFHKEEGVSTRKNHNAK